jgi:sialic acid synthase SpsE
MTDAIPAKRCFITFEAGPTHDGLETAKRLATLAAEAGADAIKFQIVDPDRLVADRRQLFSYGVLKDRLTGDMETVSEPLYDILKRRTLTAEEWRDLKRHCDVLSLDFFATVTFDDEIDLVVDMKCASIKIASGDINHLPHIRRAARTGLSIQIDTGNATLGEIEQAVDAIRAEGNDDLIIHHCPSGYPAAPRAVNLRILQTLKQMFGCAVAFSDHSPGWDMMIAAVAMGADLVEKTITLNRGTRSPEHVFSLEPKEAREFVKAMRNLELAFGSPRRLLTPQEREARLAVRRSAFLAAPAAAGTSLSDLRIEFKRPGFGLGPDEFERLANATLQRNLPAGHMLRVGDVA